MTKMLAASFRPALRSVLRLTGSTRSFATLPKELYKQEKQLTKTISNLRSLCLLNEYEDKRLSSALNALFQLSDYAVALSKENSEESELYSKFKGDVNDLLSESLSSVTTDVKKHYQSVEERIEEVKRLQVIATEKMAGEAERSRVSLLQALGKLEVCPELIEAILARLIGRMKVELKDLGLADAQPLVKWDREHVYDSLKNLKEELSDDIKRNFEAVEERIDELEESETGAASGIADELAKRNKDLLESSFKGFKQEVLEHIKTHFLMVEQRLAELEKAESSEAGEIVEELVKRNKELVNEYVARDNGDFLKILLKTSREEHLGAFSQELSNEIGKLKKELSNEMDELKEELSNEMERRFWELQSRQRLQVEGLSEELSTDIHDLKLKYGTIQGDELEKVQGALSEVKEAVQRLTENVDNQSTVCRSVNELKTRVDERLEEMRTLLINDPKLDILREVRLALRQIQEGKLVQMNTHLEDIKEVQRDQVHVSLENVKARLDQFNEKLDEKLEEVVYTPSEDEKELNRNDVKDLLEAVKEKLDEVGYSITEVRNNVGEELEDQLDSLRKDMREFVKQTKGRIRLADRDS